MNSTGLGSCLHILLQMKIRFGFIPYSDEQEMIFSVAPSTGLYCKNKEQK